MRFVKRTVFGKVSHTPAETVLITGADDPLSPQFAPPNASTSGALFNFMAACQVKEYGTTILEQFPNQYMHQKHLKILMEEYTCDIIIRAIKLASLECEHPFSARQVKRCCEKVLHVL